jgi:hypothetical protein
MVYSLMLRVLAEKLEIHIAIFSSETTGPITTKLWWNGLCMAPFQSCFHSHFFSIFSLPAILVESRDHRTQLWKGAMQRPFHQSLVVIGPVVSEEKKPFAQ